MDYEDAGADADNENTMVYTRKDMSMANAGRRSTRLARSTAKKRGNQYQKHASEDDDEALSAAEMDEKD